MISIRRVAVTRQLTINPRSARFGVLQILENDDAGPFTHYKTIAFFVEGARSLLWMSITCAHGFHGAEAPDANRHNGRLSASGEHDLGIAHLNRAPGLADGMIRGGAGRAGGEVRAA